LAVVAAVLVEQDPEVMEVLAADVEGTILQITA
jgi:hypothetical protein